MLEKGSYEHICRTADSVPEAAYSRFRPEFGARLGSVTSVMFPEFARAFPLTVMAMEAEWSVPVACLEYHHRSSVWLTSLVLERPELNLFFDLHGRDFEDEGDFYESAHAMLPKRWRELYRSFESFVITSGSVQPMGWLNTPYSYSGRLDVEELRQAVGATRAQARGLTAAVGSDRLMCWMLTEHGDALLLDEGRCDHKVYHVRGKLLSDVVVLADGEGVLDRYLSALVASGAPKLEFDFRGS